MTSEEIKEYLFNYYTEKYDELKEKAIKRTRNTSYNVDDYMQEALLRVIDCSVKNQRLPNYPFAYFLQTIRMLDLVEKQTRYVDMEERYDKPYEEFDSNEIFCQRVDEAYEKIINALENEYNKNGDKDIDVFCFTIYTKSILCGKKISGKKIAALIDRSVPYVYNALNNCKTWLNNNGYTKNMIYDL